MVVHLSCLSKASVCDPGIGVCSSKVVDDGNRPAPKQGRALVQRRIQSMKSDLKDNIGNNDVWPSPLAHNNATSAEATLTQSSMHGHKTCWKFEYVKKTEYARPYPNGFGQILKAAGVKEKNENAADCYDLAYSKDHHVSRSDEKLRNACIVYNAEHSKNDVQYYQGKDDVFNQAVAAGILTLKENGHSDDMLRDMTDEDQRNTLITKVAACDKKSVSYVQSFSTFVLVQYMNDNTRCCESTCARLTQKDWTHWCKYNCYYTYQWSHAAEAKCCK